MTGIEATTLILSKLKASDEVTSKLSSLDKKHTPAMISGIVLPSEWPVTYKTLNVYVLNESHVLEYFKIRLSINCRANTYAESRELAYAVQKTLNRWNVTGFSVTADVYATIAPDDADVDNYLTTVELLVRSN